MKKINYVDEAYKHLAERNDRIYNYYYINGETIPKYLEFLTSGYRTNILEDAYKKNEIQEKLFKELNLDNGVQVKLNQNNHSYRTYVKRKHKQNNKQNNKQTKSTINQPT